MTDQPRYPYADGDFAVLGPEVFASADGQTISWQGANYSRHPGEIHCMCGGIGVTHDLRGGARTTPDNAATSSDTADNPLREAIVAAIIQGGGCVDLAAATDAVLAVRDRETEQLRAKVAEVDHVINWHTTCASCARILDSSIRETERADRAENAIRHARSLHRENCPAAQRKVKPTAFTCGMCDALDQPEEQP